LEEPALSGKRVYKGGRQKGKSQSIESEKNVSPYSKL